MSMIYLENLFKRLGSMANLSANKVNNIIKKEYPDADNKVLAHKLGIKKQTLRSKASKLGIRKSKEFMKEQYLELQKNRKKKQEESYKRYKLTNIEKNIIIGSLLSDGTLSKYGRSLNACYTDIKIIRGNNPPDIFSAN